MAGALLLLGGRLGDLYGRRRMFLTGVVVFGLASVTSGVAQNPATLVLSRFAQGAGEALAAPAALGLIALLFTDSRERTRAIGYFGGVSGAAGTAGPILSGALVTYASWRWVFFLNVPIALIALITVPRLVHATQGADAATKRGGLDVIGAALVTAGLSGVTFGFVRAADHPWSSTLVLVPLLAGTVVTAGFVVYERGAANALVPLRFFAERTRAAANVTSVFFYSVFFGQFYFITLFLQQVKHYSPLRTGVAYLPFGLAVGAAIGLATTLIPRVGSRTVLTSGLVLSAIGTGLYTTITPNGPYVSHVLPGMIVLAFGSGLTLPTLGVAAVHRVTAGDAGLASGIQQAVQQIGGAVGLAVLATIALRDVGPTTTAAATTDGYALALRVGAVLLLLGAAISAVLLPRHDSNLEPAAATSSEAMKSPPGVTRAQRAPL